LNGIEAAADRTKPIGKTCTTGFPRFFPLTVAAWKVAAKLAEYCIKCPAPAPIQFDTGPCNKKLQIRRNKTESAATNH
jgi:hypothetical protein